jgi:hypothetical protein
MDITISGHGYKCASTNQLEGLLSASTACQIAPNTNTIAKGENITAGSKQLIRLQIDVITDNISGSHA